MKSNKEELVEKWQCVLVRCKEIPEKDWFEAATVLEKEVPKGENVSDDDILLFTLCIPELIQKWVYKEKNGPFPYKKSSAWN